MNKALFKYLELGVVVLIMIKFMISKTDSFSWFMMVPVAAILIASRLMASYDEDELLRKLHSRVNVLNEDWNTLHSDIEKLKASQDEVLKQSEETKNTLSKLNLASAFTKRG